MAFMWYRKPTKTHKVQCLGGFFCFMGYQMVSLNLRRLLVSVKFGKLDTSNFGMQVCLEELL
jgi:hypothetical protein